MLQRLLLFIVVLSVTTSFAAHTPFNVDEQLGHLEFAKGSNPSEIEVKKAYRKLALKWHPDKPEGNEAKFKKIDGAYRLLLTAYQQAKSLSAYRTKYPYEQRSSSGAGGGTTGAGTNRSGSTGNAGSRPQQNQHRNPFDDLFGGSRSNTHFNFDDFFRGFDDNDFFAGSHGSRFNAGFQRTQGTNQGLSEKEQLIKRVEKKFAELKQKKASVENETSLYFKKRYVEEAQEIVNGVGFEKGLREICKQYKHKYPQEVADWEQKIASYDIDVWAKKNLKEIDITEFTKKVEDLFEKLYHAKKEAEDACIDWLRDDRIKVVFRIAHGDSSWLKRENLKDLFNEYRTKIPEEVAKWEQDVRYTSLENWKKVLKKTKPGTRLDPASYEHGHTIDPGRKGTSSVSLSTALTIGGALVGAVIVYRLLRVHWRYKEILVTLRLHMPEHKIDRKKAWHQACDDEGFTFLLPSDYKRIDLMQVIPVTA